MNELHFLFIDRAKKCRQNIVNQRTVYGTEEEHLRYSRHLCSLDNALARLEECYRLHEKTSSDKPWAKESLSNKIEKFQERCKSAISVLNDLTIPKEQRLSDELTLKVKIKKPSVMSVFSFNLFKDTYQRMMNKKIIPCEDCSDKEKIDTDRSINY